MTTRRTFIHQAALGATGLLASDLLAQGANLPGFAEPVARANNPLRILILGGTGFTGPFQVRYAVARGHRVTVFNRGRRGEQFFGGQVEELVGDRNSDLSALRGRTWDVVIDNPTTLPVWVRDAAQVLRGNVDRYVFISTISVYASTAQPNMDESAALAPYTGADMYAETPATLQGNLGLYGPLKAASEREAERWFPGKALIIRPGLIVGPGDQSDRFTYWPVRVRRGGEVMAPGDPTDPVQFIDARDLAEWTIRMVEQGETGAFNATGPQSRLSIAEMLYGMRAAVSNDVRFTWVDADFLAAQNVRPWGHMPVWVPPRGGTAGFSATSIQRALAKGLTFRPLATTVTDTLAWWDAQDEARRAQPMRAGISVEREREVLAAWRARAG